jgi:hypothetical protein
MGYRDDLGAAQERIQTLEGELDDARAEIARLREPVAHEAPMPELAPVAARRPSRRAGRIHYHPPPRYFPTLHMLAALFSAARSSAPTLGRFDSDSVLGWALHYGVKAPLVCVGWPLYWLCMGLLVLPSAALLCIAGALLLLPFIPLSRLTFSPVPPASESALLRGEMSDGAARAMLWAIAAMFVVPMAFSGRLLRSEE